MSRVVKCPACGGPSIFSPENRWRPFCSERCRTADLGAWAEDRYRLPDKPREDDDGLLQPGSEPGEDDR
jgi:endogenous inhibitor of DNA gyrase (YacG/DUF329 family)